MIATLNEMVPDFADSLYIPNGRYWVDVENEMSSVMLYNL
jgi:hypothetical protein